MTKEEAKKMLTNTKVYVNGKSEEIQEKLFEIGFKWIVFNDTVIRNEGISFLFIGESLSQSNDMLTFKKNKSKEISAEDILNIKIDEELFPKNGDILFIKEKCSNKHFISIFYKIEGKSIYTHIDFNIENNYLNNYDLREWAFSAMDEIDELRLSTKEEKEILFSALKEKGLVWNEETKKVETIEQPKKEYVFKPFYKVLVRDFEDDKWEIDLFGKINDDDEAFPFNCLSENWTFCIPYEGNEELLDTSNSPKE